MPILTGTAMPLARNWRSQVRTRSGENEKNDHEAGTSAARHVDGHGKHVRPGRLRSNDVSDSDFHHAANPVPFPQRVFFASNLPRTFQEHQPAPHASETRFRRPCEMVSPKLRIGTPHSSRCAAKAAVHGGLETADGRPHSGRYVSLATDPRSNSRSRRGVSRPVQPAVRTGGPRGAWAAFARPGG